MNLSEWMLDAGQELSRWWPPILVLQLHSGRVRPASRIDFGQFYKIMQYSISYMYMYMYYNQPSMSPSWDVTNRSQWCENGSWVL